MKMVPGDRCRMNDAGEPGAAEAPRTLPRPERPVDPWATASLISAFLSWFIGGVGGFSAMSGGSSNGKVLLIMIAISTGAAVISGFVGFMRTLDRTRAGFG